MAESFWASPASYLSHPRRSAILYLHSYIRSKIGSISFPLLDYGCGDGLLLAPYARVGLECHAYDPSPAMLDAARSNLGARATYHDCDKSLPDNYFSAIVCSLVLMTIPTAHGIRQVADSTFRTLCQSGRLMIAVTHPCFRDETFDDFRTEFSKEKRDFVYGKEGYPFLVYLTEEEKEVRFADYHWSIASTLGPFLGGGFVLTGFVELYITSGACAESDVDGTPAFLLATLQKAVK